MNALIVCAMMALPVPEGPAPWPKDQCPWHLSYELLHLEGFEFDDPHACQVALLYKGEKIMYLDWSGGSPDGMNLNSGQRLTELIKWAMYYQDGFQMLENRPYNPRWATIWSLYDNHGQAAEDEIRAFWVRRDLIASFNTYATKEERARLKELAKVDVVAYYLLRDLEAHAERVRKANERKWKGEEP